MSFMRSVKKWVLRRVLVPSFRAMAGLWLDRKYLRGRYFDESLEGWAWVRRSFWFQFVLGINRHVPWPVSPAVAVDNPAGVFFDPEDLQIFNHFGCYYSNVGGGKIEIGKGTVVAPNVGMVTTNHDLADPAKHQPPGDIRIGKNCWLGMGCILLPGVTLGDNTVVGAHALVNRSFPEGWCVLAGSPARIIRRIERPHEQNE